VNDTGTPGDPSHGSWGDLVVRLLAWAVRPPAATFVESAQDGRHLSLLRERGIDSLWVLARGIDDPAQRIYERVWQEQRRLLAEFHAAMQAEGIACLALKGMPLVQRWHGRALGCMSDVDLLVRRDDVLRTIPVLHALGLRPRIHDAESGRMKYRDVAEKAAVEAQHYELVGYNRCVALELSPAELDVLPQLLRHSLRIVDGQPSAIVELDIHHGLASDLDSAEFFERAVTSADGIGTLCDADHLWFGLSRLYAEVALHGKDSLRDFAYLGPLVTRGDVDWSVVLDAAQRLELRPALFYFLKFLDFLAGRGAVPGPVFDELDPRKGVRFRDWGWQLGRLLGQVDPDPFESR